MDCLEAGNKRLLDIQELEELQCDAYENTIIYKERTKAWHDKRITRKEFRIGDIVLLFNSRLRSRWNEPFESLRLCHLVQLRLGVNQLTNSWLMDKDRNTTPTVIYLPIILAIT